MEAVLAVAVKSTVILLAALAAAALAHRARAAVRHAIFAAAFLALLLLPAASTLAPQIRLPVFDAVSAPAVAAQSTVAAPPSEHAAAPAPSSRATRSRWGAADLAIAIYAIGAGSILLMLFAGVLRLRAWASDATGWPEATTLARELAPERSVLVAISDRVQSPLTFGLFQSTILLPPSASAWSSDERSRALQHELEHVRRGDWKLQLLARLACALYWPHPLMWAAWRRFVLEAERACDDAVLAGADPSQYAEQLVTLARDLARRERVPAMAMASRSQLARRIDAILDPARSRGPAGLTSRMFASAAVLLIVLAFGPVRLVAAVREASPASDSVIDGVRDGVAEGVSGGVACALA
jgi:beta-lactamase regulating signal transducer with metallopeptidase domain